MQATTLDGIDVLPHARKTRAILAILCLARGKRVTRAQLADLLWDRSDGAHAQGSLRQALADLKRSVGRLAPDLIEIDRETLRLNSEGCRVDIFEPGEHPEALLIDLDGVSPAFDRWLKSERDRFEDGFRRELESELDRLVSAGAAPELRAAAARKLVNFDPVHEGAVRHLMTAFVEMGDRVQAIREFERLRIELQARLDLAPSRETLAVYQAARLISPKNRWAVTEQNLGNRESSHSNEPHLSQDARQAAQRRQLSVAVLPIQNLSPETMHDYTADGLVEDLIDVLSRVPGFFVIARSSTSVFKTEHRPPAEIGAVLGVQYIVSGSMRVRGDHLRLSAELTDTHNGAVLWRSAWNERFFDLLEIQGRLADAVVRRLAPVLYSSELRRARTKSAEQIEARDLLLRAQENMNNPSRIVFETAERLFDEAIRLDRKYATPLAWRAYWHVLRVAQGWSANLGYDVKHASNFAQQAVDADPLDPMALAIQGHVAAYLHKDFDTAFQRFEAALRVNPNAGPAWLWSSAAHAWIGQGERAVQEIERAIALSPFDPLMCAYSAVAGMAFLANGQYDRAFECGLRSIGENRNYSAAYKLILLALVLAGREAETLPYIDGLLRAEPGFTVERYQRVFPGGNTATGVLYCDALTRAGVPAK